MIARNKNDIKMKYKYRRRNLKKNREKTMFCLCPPGNTIKLNLNNSNKK